MPRVTLGIATYNRDTYLAEAVASALAQDYDSLEVLVVLDGSTNPRIEQILAGLEDPRLRIVRHPHNRGIAAAYNTFVEAGRGELIAMLGDDDVALPGRIRRQVEIFDRYPDTGVVHGDATIIDAAGKLIGHWPSADFTPAQLLSAAFFRHNHIVDPTRMVHRRVYETVGGYDDRFPVANDFDLWLRAAPHFRFRHVPGGPLSAIRRHGANASDEAAGRQAELADVETILAEAVERHTVRELCPELDWAVLDPARAQRAALARIADRLEGRALPVPGLAAELRRRAAATAVPALAPPTRGRLMITAFGWNDAGGGTAIPRLSAKALRRRGWEVTVFYAATEPTPSGVPYETVEWEEDGVRLIGVHNRPHGLFDLGHPDRELDDPEITGRFADALDQYRPDVVHFHNLHNLGAALIDAAAVRGLPAYFSTHNYWLVCPRAYLMDGHGQICPGPGDGSRCASCVGSPDVAGHRRRLAEIRTRAEAGLTSILAVSDAVAATLESVGYDASGIRVVRQATPQDDEIWAQLGSRRAPGRRAETLRVAFVGSAYAHKGPQLLARAAQLTRARVRVRILGEIGAPMAAAIGELDERGVVELAGAFAPSEIAGRLADVDAAVLPSLWWDCAPLAAAECRAAGLPLVVPRLGGLAEVIEDGVDGLLFDGLDAASLAAALDRLASESGLLERLAANIPPPRSFDAYVDELESIYRSSPGPGLRLTSPPRVRWQGDFALNTSLSIVNREISGRLDVELQRVDRSGHPLDRPLRAPASLEIRHSWPPDLSPAPAGALAVILPWEFGAVPAAWVESIHRHVDELWVPSEYVRRMYLDAGIAPERVRVLPNGVDLDTFTPAPTGSTPSRPDRAACELTGPVRFLFVGGLILRKGPDLLLAGFQRAFAGRDDVTLVIKDFGADGIYRTPGAQDPMRDPIRAHIAAGALPRIELIDRELDTEALVGLYRSCDVLVHPYRGEGFAMPVLEAMATGLPVIATAGGPTDEFCPPEAGWRVRSERRYLPPSLLGDLAPLGRPWMLEPDLDDLVAQLRRAAASPGERRMRGAAARAAAAELAWPTIAARYAERVEAVSRRGPRTKTPGAGGSAAAPDGEAELRVLATPAWRGVDALGDLLAGWAAHTVPGQRARLHLLASSPAAGSPEAVEAHVLAVAAAAGVDLEDCADVTILYEPVSTDRDVRLHRTMSAYVPLHAGCAGHERLARAAGNRIVPVSGLAGLCGATAGVTQ